MTSYTTQRIRVLQDVTKWYESGQDVLTASSPRFGNGCAVQFEFAFSFGELEADADLVDVGGYSSLTLDIKRFTDRTGLALMTKTVALEDLDDTVTKATWEDLSKQHVVFDFTEAESDIFITGTEENLWLVVSGVTAGGRLVTLGAWIIVVVEDGAGVETPAAVVAPTFYTAAQSDARYLLATDLSTKLNRDGSNVMTGDLTLANSTPSNNLHAASKAYVDTQRDTRLALAGGTLTGLLTLVATTPSSGNHAAHKTYVDSVGTAAQAASVPNTGTSTIAGLKTFSSLLTASAGISVAGGVTLTSGALTLFAAPSTGMHAATKTYVDAGDTAAAAASVPNTGTSTIAGSKTFSSLVTMSAGATVSGAALTTATLVVGSLSGVLKAGSGTVAGSATTSDLTEGSNLYYTDTRVRACVLTGLSAATGGTIAATDTMLVAFGRAENRIAALESTRMLKAGDTMTGPLVFSGATNYGIRLANFAASSLPASPAVGGLIYDTTNAYLRFWTGSTWKVLNEAGTSGVTWYDGSSTPSGGVGANGDYYVETQDDDAEGTIWKKSGGSWAVIVSPALKIRGGTLTGALTFQDGLSAAIVFGTSGWNIYQDFSVTGDYVLDFGGNAMMRMNTSGVMKIYTGGSIQIGGTQVLTSRQTDIVDTSGASLAALETEVNALKAMIRVHGLMG